MTIIGQPCSPVFGYAAQSHQRAPVDVVSDNFAHLDAVGFLEDRHLYALMRSNEILWGSRANESAHVE